MEALRRNRDDIDAIDREILRLFARRMEAVRAIGDLKADDPDAPLRDPDRERVIFARWVEEGRKLGLAPHFLGRILREVLSYSRRDQERTLGDRDVPQVGAVRVAYQGMPGAYSELALEKLWTARGEGRLAGEGFQSFSAAFDALTGGDVDYALLPVENTLAGSIDEVYRLALERDVHAIDEEVWQVEHCLCAPAGAKLEDIAVVRSHPVALQQCRKLLEGLVGARAEAHWDTAAAAASVASDADPTIAALCSIEAAHAAGLAVLKEGVADSHHNVTRFLLFAREPKLPEPRLPARTSLVLTLNHRRGSLATCLSAFASAGVNLTKIESRPVPEQPWEVQFYVDAEGSVAEPELAGALEVVGANASHVRVLGSYPRRTEDVRPPESWGPPEPEASEETGAVCTAPATPSAPATPATPERRIVSIGAHDVGGERFTLIAGPCAVESREQVLAAAEAVSRAGAHLLRGGAFKPRTSPRSFQGLGFPGLELLAEAGRAIDLPIVTEVLRAEDVERLADSADVLQVGARNMQNFALLKALGRIRRPVLLKRGMSATVDELVKAADYLLDGGNQRVILCERGIRTFEPATRATLDVSAIPVLKEKTPLPVIVDPSHAAGRRELVVPLALAAAAVGADGLIVEVHPNPSEALCDGEQALLPADLEELVRRLRPILAGQGRTL